METESPSHFFILGAAKCGTTSLYHLLDQHPEICMSKPKEPTFLERDYHQGLGHYHKTCFAHYQGQPFAGEARHRNLYLKYVPKRIAEMFPNAALFAILRNPVERAFSHYLHRRRHGQEKLSFEDALEEDAARIERERGISDDDLERIHCRDLSEFGSTTNRRTYLDTGYYALQLKRYEDCFGGRKVKVFLTEDLHKDPAGVYRSMLQAISSNLKPVHVDHRPQNENPGSWVALGERLGRRVPALETLSRSLVPKTWRPKLRSVVKRAERWVSVEGGLKMRPQTRGMLIDHYREHNHALAGMLGRDLSGWE